MSVKPIPEGYEGITPYLICKNAEAAMDFYKRAFGAEELFRIGGGGMIGVGAGGGAGIGTTGAGGGGGGTGSGAGAGAACTTGGGLLNLLLVQSHTLHEASSVTETTSAPTSARRRHSVASSR